MPKSSCAGVSLKGTFNDWFAKGEAPLKLLRKSERAALEEKLEEAR